MSGLYRHLIRPFLFSYDSEDIHNRTMAALRHASQSAFLCEALSYFYGSPALPTTVFGLRFPNPVGLAAGMDKHAAAAPIWPSLGFGFSELGGVTRHAQPGNPEPRMFRVPADGALINRMGFNNPGAEALACTLREWKDAGRWPAHPVGINLGKSKITPLEEAAADYLFSFQALRDFADFFVVNVSSPNTPNLRQLQDKAALDEILHALQSENERGLPKPILVKIAPDLSFSAIDEILQLLEERRIAGIVATNTTIARPHDPPAELKPVYERTGGLSGRPLRQRSTEIIRHIYSQTRGSLPIIGVGGIFTVEDAWEKITAGASLLQIYSGMVYEGPTLAKILVEGLRLKLHEQGLTTISQAVGRTDLNPSEVLQSQP